MKRIEEVFPKRFYVNKKIIKNSQPYNTHNCIGHNSIKEILKKENIKYDYITWGSNIGDVLIDNTWYKIKTNTNMILIEKPEKVSFKIISIDKDEST